jgi:ribosomal-protein-serine acetyltransferase
MLVIPSRSDLRAMPIVTERLFLVPLDPADAPEMWLAVESSREHLGTFLPWVAFHTEEAASLRFAEASVLDWDQGRAMRFAIRQRAGRSFVGLIGLEALVHMHRSGEIGYWLRKDVTGRGFMTEAVLACMDLAFRHVGLHRLRIAAATDNHASLAVIQRARFRFEGIGRSAEWCAGRWLDHAQFALLSTDPR